MKNAEKLFIFVVTIIFIFGFGLILAFPVKWCWNYAMPYLFGLKTITWSHAFCLYVLASMLIKATQTNNK